MGSGLEEAYFSGETSNPTSQASPYFIMAIVCILISYEQGSLDNRDIFFIVANFFNLPQTSRFGRELVTEALRIPILFSVLDGSIGVLKNQTKVSRVCPLIILGFTDR